MSNYIQSVQSLYAAFGRGDIPTILAALRPDVDWHANVDPKSPGVAKIPPLKPSRSPKEVGGFFQSLSGLEFHSFVPVSFMAGEREVAARVDIDATVKSTGNRLKMQSVHHWVFDETGKVSRFVEYLDTLSQAAAWGTIREK